MDHLVGARDDLHMAGRCAKLLPRFTMLACLLASARCRARVVHREPLVARPCLTTVQRLAGGLGAFRTPLAMPTATLALRSMLRERWRLQCPQARLGPHARFSLCVAACFRSEFLMPACPIFSCALVLHRFRDVHLLGSSSGSPGDPVVRRNRLCEVHQLYLVERMAALD